MENKKIDEERPWIVVEENAADWRREDTEIVFICAAREEYNEFISYLRANNVQLLDAAKGKTSTFARYSAHRFRLEVENGGLVQCMVITPGKMGMVPSGALCAHVLEKLRPKLVVMPGICGGIPNAVKRGHLVVVEKTYDYGAGKIDEEGNFRPAGDSCSIDGTLNPCIDDAEKALESIMATCKRGALKIELDGGIEHVLTKCDENEKGDVKVRRGAMPSGAAVVNELGYVEKWIKDTIHKPIAYDMEAYAVAFMCDNFRRRKTPWFVVKGVQDLPGDDSKRKGVYTRAMAHLSAAFAVDVARRFAKP